MGKIDTDFNEAIRQAEALEGLADQINTLGVNGLQNTLQNISCNWKGENANIFLEKGDRFKEELLDTAHELRSIAESLKARAKWVYDVEQVTQELIGRN